MSHKKSVILSIVLWVMLCMFYYNIFDMLAMYTIKTSNTKVFSIRRIDYRWFNDTLDEENYLISTPGCSIANYSRTLHFKESVKYKYHCNDRIVSVEKISDHEIVFHIDSKKIKTKGNNFQCCFKFANRSSVPGQEDKRIIYSKCEPFKDGTKAILQEEVITVSCLMDAKHKSKTMLSYEDAYFILKKKFIEDRKIPMKYGVDVALENWNVLIIGMDTMSRGRAYNSLPKTVKYLKERNWLDYRGYHKVGYNTFPNVMSMLSGLNSSRAYSVCGQGMDKCKHLLIWNKLKEAGYVTAYVEDNLSLPDTFSSHKGFKLPPTDHYGRPFFLTGEHVSGNYVCTKSKPSAKHLLDYAEQFAAAYKNDSFFGYFWINSCSHNLRNLPTLFEDDFVHFFTKLEHIGVLRNTFVFFLSDHGIRYGGMRVTRESYYEERLPMLFTWVPYEFRELHPEKHYNLQLNQYRLTTPYDLHQTLKNIIRMGNRYLELPHSVECPECLGLTEEISPQRTCANAHIDEKWCSCHNMTKSRNDTAAEQSLQLALSYLQKQTESVKTINCMKCSTLQLKSVLRSDSYTHNNKTYYVIAFVVKPGNVGFEANVEHYGNNFNLLPPTETISEYGTRNRCVVNPTDWKYCVCETVKNCKESEKKKDNT